jgi:hypothetical protein
MAKFLLSEEQKKEITDLAAVFFTPKEIAVIMEWFYENVAEDMQDQESDFYKAYYKGRLQSEYDLRKSVVKLAKSGSSPAQTMAMDMLNKSKLKMIGS